MQPFQPNFNQIQAPGVTPQLNAQQIDLGIDRVAAEFSRQESGRRQNLQAMRDNQAAMQRSLKTQMDRSKMDWKNYMKLADFSETLSDTLVENQKQENKRVMMENMNQAFLDGADPNKQAKYREDVEKLNQADNAAIEVSRRYLESGGLPDIAAEIEKRSGWAAYGYAVGIAKNGAKGYDSFLMENKKTPVGQRDDGTPITLENAQNSGEYLAAVKTLRDQYVAPYLGLNQELLNEYLVDPMRLSEDTAFAEWEEEFAKNREKELELQQTAELYAVKDNGENAAKLTEQLIKKEAVRNGGNFRLAKQTVMKRWQTLAENGSLTQAEAIALLEYAQNTGAGKDQKYINTAEGKAILAAAIKYENDVTGAKLRQQGYDREQAIQALHEGIRKDGPLTEEGLQEAIEMLGPLGMSPAQVRSEFRTVDQELERQAVQEVTKLVSNGQYVPLGLLKQVGPNYANLRQQALELNQARTVNMGLTTQNATYLKKFIKGEADKGAGTIGTTAESTPESIAAQRRAMEWAQQWLQSNRYSYPNESAAMEALEAALREQFSPADPKRNAQGVVVTGFDASPFNTVNQPDATGLNQLYQKNSLSALQNVQALVQAGNTDPYSVGAIPGTEKELEFVKESLEKTGRIPANTPIFTNLARQSNGTATAQEIIERQLKVVYGIEHDQDNEGTLTIDRSLDPREVRKLLTINPTANTVYRAGMDVEMSNASQQGALSDPSDPNSPRIGEFVGGDGDLVAQGQGGQYTLNMTAVPGGFGPTIQSAADTYGIPADILAALIEQESGFRANAYNPSGATGIAQIIPKWHPEANPGVDPHADIMYAAKYLRQMMTDYGFDLETAIYAYNAGPDAVIKYGKGASNENRKYYPEIMEKAKKYRRKSYRGLRSNWNDRVADSPYNSPDLISTNLRGRIYQLA